MNIAVIGDGAWGTALALNMRSNGHKVQIWGAFPDYLTEIAGKHDLMIHIHASETAREVEECIAKHGMTPIAWLDHLGLLSEKTLLAHCTHLTCEDIRLISSLPLRFARA